MGRYYTINAYGENKNFSHEGKLWFGMAETGISGEFGDSPVDYYYNYDTEEYIAEHDLYMLSDEEYDATSSLPEYCETHYYIDELNGEFKNTNLFDKRVDYLSNFNFRYLISEIDKCEKLCNNLESIEVEFVSFNEDKTLKVNKKEINIIELLKEIKDKIMDKKLSFEYVENVVEEALFNTCNMTNYNKDFKEKYGEELCGKLSNILPTISYGCMIASLLFEYGDVYIEENYS